MKKHFFILIIATFLMSSALAATEKAIFAGGCFWCMESDFQELAGVTDVVSGFTGGGIALTKLYTNDGSGSFTEVTASPFTGLTSGYFNFGDLDGDDDMDIVFSGGHTGIDDVVKYTNDGSGSFTLDTTIGVTDISGVLDLSDIDNDNKFSILKNASMFEF